MMNQAKAYLEKASKKKEETGIIHIDIIAKYQWKILLVKMLSDHSAFRRQNTEKDSDIWRFNCRDGKTSCNIWFPHFQYIMLCVFLSIILPVWQWVHAFPSKIGIFSIAHTPWCKQVQHSQAFSQKQKHFISFNETKSTEDEISFKKIQNLIKREKRS